MLTRDRPHDGSLILRGLIRRQAGKEHQMSHQQREQRADDDGVEDDGGNAPVAGVFGCAGAAQIRTGLTVVPQVALAEAEAQDDGHDGNEGEEGREKPEIKHTYFLSDGGSRLSSSSSSFSWGGLPS